MNSSKRENLLNLALDATEEERQQSLNLNVGYQEETDTWEVIVKYTGSLRKLEEIYPDIEVTELSNEYAVIRLPEALMDAVTDRTEIEYMEKPKRLFFSVQQGIRASCITPLYTRKMGLGGTGLSGKGVITAFLDSGIDYRHPDFRKEDGSSRILAIWDQSIAGNPPAGFRLGTESMKHCSRRIYRRGTVSAPAGIYPGTEPMWQESQREMEDHPMEETGAWHMKVICWW